VSQVRKFLEKIDPSILCVDGYDDAIIAFCHDRGYYKAVYDIQKMIEICSDRGNFSADEAIEYLEYNCWNAFHGEGTPIYINLIEGYDIWECLPESYPPE